MREPGITQQKQDAADWAADDTAIREEHVRPYTEVDGVAERDLVEVVRRLLTAEEGRIAMTEVTEEMRVKAREIVRRAGIRPGLFTGPRTFNAVEAIAGAIADFQPTPAASSTRAAGESAVLDFEQWQLRWCADNGRKMSQTEYGIAMAAFYSAHPAEGPFSHTMSGDTREPGIREAAAEWQPMPMAPRDGRKILLWWPQWCQQPVTGYWSRITEGWSSNVNLSDGPEPLAWMPLPSPPEQPTKEK